MKHLIKTILLAVTMIAIADEARAQGDILAQADSAYNETAYNQALELYSHVADSIGASDNLYYNIGNTYYRNGDLGRAILWYERALQLNPANSDARDNLMFVNTRITDKPVDNRSIIKRAYDSIVDSAHPNVWAWTALGFFVATILATMGYLLLSNVKVRKACFFGGGVLLLITIFTLVMSIDGTSRANNHDNAIIISPSAQLSTAPRAAVDASSQAFLLHEGTKVEIVDSVIGSADKWYEVRVNGNARAWVNGNDIERI